MTIVYILLGAVLMAAGVALCLAVQWQIERTYERFGLSGGDDWDDVQRETDSVDRTNHKSPDPSLN